MQHLHKQHHSTIPNRTLNPPPRGLHAFPLRLTHGLDPPTTRKQRAQRAHELHLRELLPGTYAIAVGPRHEGPAGRGGEGFTIQNGALFAFVVGRRSGFDPPRGTPHVDVSAPVAWVGVDGGEGGDDVDPRWEEEESPVDFQRAGCGAGGLDDSGEWGGGAEGLVL